MKFAQARLSPPTFAQVASEAALDIHLKVILTKVSEYRERRDTYNRTTQNWRCKGSYS
jgi:aspartate aminotransferase